MNACFLPVDKPAGVTSHDVVAMLKSVTGAAKVGHTGTLDPFATGVLALAFEGATRLISYLDEDLKVYDATIALGAATDTGDPTGQVIRSAEIPALSDADIAEVLGRFKGVMMQAPPRYSAVKVQGRPLYSYARAGEDVEAAPRPTRIDEISLTERGPDWLRVLITCGRGTYARVLADEIGTALGTAGHLSALRRTRTGIFDLSRALRLEDLAQLVAGISDWERALRPSRGPDRVRWAPRDTVRAGLERYAVRPLDALSHLPIAPLRPGERLGSGLLPMAPAAAVGDTYLVVQGQEVMGIAVREPRGPRLVRALTDGPGTSGRPHAR